MTLERSFIKKDLFFNRLYYTKKAENSGFLTVSTEFSTKKVFFYLEKHYFSTFSTVKPVERVTLMIRLQLGDNNTNCNCFVHNYVHKIVHHNPKNVHSITERINMKGINKLVMEVNPDDGYFEKAILFLKPVTAEKPQHEISDGAEKLLSKIKESNNKKKKHSIITAFLLWSSGAAFMWLLLFIAEHVF